MKIKLIDVKTNTYETQFGTCELCMHFSIEEEPTYIFLNLETNEEIMVDGYIWAWGCLDIAYMGNYLDLADIISKYEWKDDIKMDYGFLVDLDDWIDSINRLEQGVVSEVYKSDLEMDIKYYEGKYTCNVI